MDFILNEAEEDRTLVFSDDEEDEKVTDKLDDFIDDSTQPQEDITFYRQLDPNNINDYPKFHGQTRNPIEATYEDDTPFYGHEDQHPELYDPEDRERDFERSIENLKKP